MALAAAQWMKRRGPALQKHKVSRLFRTRHIRFIEPETNLVHRARRDRILQPGSRLLVPKFALGQDVQHLSEKTLKSVLPALSWVCNLAERRLKRRERYMVLSNSVFEDDPLERGERISA